MYVPRAMYSFKMSFWIVPLIALAGTPCSSATNSYSNSRIAAVELIVMLIDAVSSGMSAKSMRMSAIESMATPTLPTSPSARGWSLS